MNWDIKSAGKILYSPLTDYSSGGSVATTSTDKPSIFGVKNKCKLDNDNNSDAQAISAKISEEQMKFIEKYDLGKMSKEAENIEKALGHSKVPNLPGVGGFIKLEIKQLCKDIRNICGSITTKCANCKTEDEVKAIVKDIETELQQKKHKANVYMQRGKMAIELDKKLGAIYADPEKAKSLKNISIEKITSKLTEPVEDVNTNEIENNNNLEDKEKDEKIKDAFSDALKNDEITNVIKSLLKFVEKGEKDDILKDYVKDDQSEINTSNNALGMSNLFSKTEDKKKNPFFT